MLLSFIGREQDPSFGHAFKGRCVHNRRRRSTEEEEEPWSVSDVLKSTGHGEGWDSRDECDDDVAPTFDNSDDVHVVDPGKLRQDSDQRRAFAIMMAKSKDNVGDMLRSVGVDKALEWQGKADEFAKFLVQGEGAGTMNPKQAPKRGRPKAPRVQTNLGGVGDVGNPEGRLGKERRNKRIKDGFGPGSGCGPSKKARCASSASGGGD